MSKNDRRTSTARSERTRKMREVAAQMEDTGIDPQRLIAAFSHVDEQGDGELELYEFRELWRLVFPQRPMDERSWKHTESMFREIDIDGSGKITFEEIVTFLDVTVRQEQRRTRRPQTIPEWIWQFSGSETPEWMEERDASIGWAITAYKTLENVAIVTSIVVLMIESLPEYQSENRNEIPGSRTTFAIEAVCVCVFVVQFVMWTVGYPGEVRIKGSDTVFSPYSVAYQRIKESGEGTQLSVRKWGPYALETDTWIDIVSILPFFLQLIVTGGHQVASLAAVRMLRLLRLLRILRVLRVGRGKFGRAPELGAALLKSMMSLWFLLILVCVAMTLSASAIFYFELEQAHFNHTQSAWVRDADSEYLGKGAVIFLQSIPDALWWSIVTLTTVGYGDTYPVTIGGKVVATITMLGGLIVVGYPITILTSTFQAMEQERGDEEERLERCREFYLGLKSWLDNETMEQSFEDDPMTARSNVEGGMVQLTDCISNIERRLLTRLEAFDRRIQVLEEALPSKLLSPEPY